MEEDGRKHKREIKPFPSLPNPRSFFLPPLTLTNGGYFSHFVFVFVLFVYLLVSLVFVTPEHQERSRERLGFPGVMTALVCDFLKERVILS